MFVLYANKSYDVLTGYIIMNRNKFVVSCGMGGFCYAAQLKYPIVNIVMAKSKYVVGTKILEYTPKNKTSLECPVRRLFAFS